MNDVSVTLSRQKKVAKSNDQSSEPNFVLQITIHFDGGSRGNPGVAGAGSEVVIVNRSTDVTSTSTYSVREYCGESATNNFAEYNGLLAGLETTKSFIEKLVSGISLPKTATRPLFRLKVYGDSNLIIQQMRGTWQCKHPNIMPFFHACRSLIEAMKKYDARSVVEFEHVYREQNKVADGEFVERNVVATSPLCLQGYSAYSANLCPASQLQKALANEAMDRRESWITSTTDVPISGGVEKKPTGRKNIASAPSTKEAIDVDDSDENSHHSC